uniref:Uncharacterized protein n=1 Tax=Arundo donax TaxID=35708 RepID=A0A0A9D133_ARUDO
MIMHQFPLYMERLCVASSFSQILSHLVSFFYAIANIGFPEYALQGPHVEKKHQQHLQSCNCQGSDVLVMPLLTL